LEEKNDSEKLVEVKTTARGKFFLFYVTQTELCCSEAMAQQFRLFRLPVHDDPDGLENKLTKGGAERVMPGGPP
jgi:hypothetical protein